MTITTGTAPEVGSTVRVYLSIVDPGGVAADPDTLEVLVKDPDGAVTTYVYGASPDTVFRTAVGEFYLDVEATEADEWFFRGEAASAAWTDTEEGSFVVRESLVN